MRKFLKFLLLLVTVGVLVFVYATFIESKLLTVKSHEFSYTSPSEEKGTSIKIAHFTDTQIGEFYSMGQFEKVVKKINKQKPDMIVFTGDLFDMGATEAEIQEIIALLKEMEAPYGKFSVYGNRDVGGGMVRNYERLLTDADFTLLKNEETTITLPNGEELLIYGLDDALLGSPDIADVNNVLSRNQNTLVLLHEPDVAKQLESTDHALVLAGHSHGGQVYLPFIGPLATTSLAEEYVKGWYTLSGNTNPNLYVNTGIGNTKLPFRLGNIPQVALIELHL
ncbi:metallophosphoesterase [Lysinibacillus sp. NPDC097287]|uniref:metallophosphoesterase n=1 Tax=Lysinibacillus sp. NPDC097287 TaxID=3364144 RepID=UPI00382C5260